MARILKALREIVIGKLSDAAWICAISSRKTGISSSAPPGEELKVKQGLEGNKAKGNYQAIKSQGFKVQSQLQDQQIRHRKKKRRPASCNSVRAQSRPVSPQTLKISGTEQRSSSFRGCKRVICAFAIQFDLVPIRIADIN